MRIVIRSEGVKLWLPLPLSLATVAIGLLPESVFSEMRSSVPESCHSMITKKCFREIVRECRSTFKQYKGLEILHVETQDGTFVSIRL